MRTVFTPDHELFRDSVRKFIAAEIVPFHEEWEKDGFVPRDLWRKAGEMGLLLTSIPDEYGGAGGDFSFSAVVIEELARVNASGPGFSMHSDIVAHYFLQYGTEEQKQRWLPPMARGEMIGALGMTEPNTGSDVKAIRTTAVRDGDHYVINGQKTFITNGHHTDLIILAVKTAPDLGRKGISLIVVEGGMEGFNKGRNLKKIGLLAQDTAELFFDNVRVPATNLLGEENEGFGYLMHNLPQERLVIALRAAASIEAMLENTAEYAKERKVFGKPLFELQNTRFSLASIKAQSEMLRVFVDHCLGLLLRGELTPERAAMAKLLASEIQNRALDDMLQLYGGYGYMEEYVIGRAWRDARIMRIYGGSSEIMKEIIARGI
ncbi:acyl-CoA dehydrogenase family protein [Actibacterium sp. D379-3]